MRKIVILAVLVAVATVSCVTTPQRTLVDPLVLDGELLVARADYLPPELLRIRYGRTNPFIALPMLLTPVEFLVLNTEIRNMSASGVIELNRVELHVGGQTYSPTTPARMRAYWESTDSLDDMNAVDRRRFFSLIDTEMINRSTRPVEGVAAGLLIFRGRRFPVDGPGRIIIPITDTATGRIHRETIEFEFAEIRDGRR